MEPFACTTAIVGVILGVCVMFGVSVTVGVGVSVRVVFLVIVDGAVCVAVDSYGESINGTERERDPNSNHAVESHRLPYPRRRSSLPGTFRR
jgi:hypothetical protein